MSTAETPTSELRHELKMYTGETVHTRWADLKADAEQIASEFRAGGYYNVRVFFEPRTGVIAPYRIVGWVK